LWINYDEDSNRLCFNPYSPTAFGTHYITASISYEVLDSAFIGLEGINTNTKSL